LKKSDLDKLFERDGWCWHCGTIDTLVPHHRANRGFGGYKALDTLQNVILVCSYYNGLMESDADVANEARQLGHKLSKFLPTSFPVYDNWQKKWYVLDDKGNKREDSPPRL
jgi:hypothetical protein